jgi:hypothetical protein
MQSKCFGKNPRGGMKGKSSAHVCFLLWWQGKLDMESISYVRANQGTMD